jgi:hypothetical protein
MRGLLIREPNKGIEAKAKGLGLGVTISAEWAIPYAHTLIVSGGALPWGLIGAGLHFLERWDVAAPLWRYGVLAQDLGTPAERQRTAVVCRDLRIPVYAPELLFVRQSEAGEEFLRVWRAECALGDERLAFLRALCLVKPLFCALPCNWLADGQVQAQPHREHARATGRTSGLISVEIRPGVSVKCFPGEEDKVRRKLQHKIGRRRS